MNWFKSICAAAFVALLAPAANAMPISVTVGIPDLFPHGLGPGGLDLPVGTPGRVRFNLGVGASDSWTVTVTNLSAYAWTDFHLELFSNFSLAEFEAGTAVKGWGALPAGDFSISPNGGVADFGPVPQTVKPGKTTVLTINVMNHGAYIINYSMRVRATVPEAPSFFIVAASLLLLGLYLGQRRRALSQH